MAFLKTSFSKQILKYIEIHHEQTRAKKEDVDNVLKHVQPKNLCKSHGDVKVEGMICTQNGQIVMSSGCEIKAMA